MIGTVTRDIRTMLNNGQRALLVALLSFMAAVLFFVGVTILAFFWDRSQGPVAVTMDFRIVDNTVTYGDGLLFTVEYCNITDKPVQINRSVIMTEISREPPTNVLYYNDIPLTVEPGCVQEPPTEAPLPPEIVVGHWRVKHVVFTRPSKGERREVVVNQPEFTVTK